MPYSYLLSVAYKKLYAEIFGQHVTTTWCYYITQKVPISPKQRT